MNGETTTITQQTTSAAETTTTTVSLSEQEMFQRLDEQLTTVNNSFTFICALLAAGLVALVCRYCYRFLNIFF